MEIVDIIERLRQIPYAQVDKNFGQGHESVREQLNQRSGGEDSFIDNFISGSRDTIMKLAEMSNPYSVPEDYIRFLELCGGLAINAPNYRFELHGVGPMILEWYGDVEEENFSSEPGLTHLCIGYLRFESDSIKDANLCQKDASAILEAELDESSPFDSPTQITPSHYSWVRFLIDLAGTVQQNSIIGIGPDEGSHPHPFSQAEEDRRAWKKVADSFTEWLNLAVETRGTFGYLQAPE